MREGKGWNKNNSAAADFECMVWKEGEKIV